LVLALQARRSFFGDPSRQLVTLRPPLQSFGWIDGPPEPDNLHLDQPTTPPSPADGTNMCFFFVKGDGATAVWYQQILWFLGMMWVRSQV